MSVELLEGPVIAPAPSTAAQAAHRRRPVARGVRFAGMVFLAMGVVAATKLSGAMDSPPSLMAPSDYLDAKRAIEAQARAALGDCRERGGSAREVCRAQARGDAAVQRAELEARYRGTGEAALQVRLTEARAQFEVARARCAAKEGDAHSECLRIARGGKQRAYAEARAGAS